MEQHHIQSAYLKRFENNVMSICNVINNGIERDEYLLWIEISNT